MTTYYYASGQRIAMRERTAATDVRTYLRPSLLRADSDHPALHSGQAWAARVDAHASASQPRNVLITYL